MKKTLMCIGLCLMSHHALATVWAAGSTHKGTVTVPIENGPNVVWKCDGKTCIMSGPWGNELSLDSCQSLVMRVGKISYYRNSKGKIWDSKSSQLAECNRTAQ